MKTRCKFQVQKVADLMWDITEPSPEDPHKMVSMGKKAQELTLVAVYGGLTPEDVSFFRNTPVGNMTLVITNPSVVGSYKPGDFCYIDIIPIE